jgi:hypothetical protein
MSFSSVNGFSGGDALLAFAAIQQGRMNDEMSEGMRIADLRSQMSGDLADLKSHLEQANRDPKQFNAVDQELHAFMDKYGSVPELEEVTSTVGEITRNIDDRLEDARQSQAAQYASAYAGWASSGYEGSAPPRPGPPVIGAYSDETIKSWLDQITGKLDASGTNDQLAMIHIKQLNDNINNSSGMVSGIIESRQNSMASIINNIA